MTTWTPKDLAVRLLSIISKDRERLERLDRYARGYHDPPYTPEGADEEYRTLVRRSVLNLLPMAETVPAQMLYVDDFDPGLDESGEGDPDTETISPEYDHFQRSGLDARQLPLYRGAFRFGHAFTETYIPEGKDKSVTRGISALKSAALFEDPANDIVAYAALEIVHEPILKNGDVITSGEARLWTPTHKHKVLFNKLGDDKGLVIFQGAPIPSCPIVRFAPDVDLEGRTTGLLEPWIDVQDRLNQTVLDLLIAQTHGSFQVRTITGMAPPLEQEPILDEDGEPTGEWQPKVDSKGNFVPKAINLNAKRFLYAEDPEVKFGSLPPTPLDGYLRAIEQGMREFAALTQTPPHFILGQIANMSAEGLQAAETALARKVEALKHTFGESWEQVFRIAAELDGDPRSATDYRGEVRWRDIEARSLSRDADALSKLKDLGIPAQGLWRRVPGTTGQEIRRWEQWRDEDPTRILGEAIERGSSPLEFTEPGTA